MRRLIVAITGASGAVYGIRALQLLREAGGFETHLIVTAAGARTIVEETDFTVAQVRALADVVHPARDIGAPIASGSFTTHGMLVAPCSVKTLAGIAHGYDDELVARAADVCLKERRRVVLLLRETPLHAGHIALMDQATRNGAIVMPPVPAFYHRPRSIAEIVDQTVGRALALFDIDVPQARSWDGHAPRRADHNQETEMAKQQPPTFEAFEQAARARGFDEILVRVWEPGLVNESHAHPFDVDAWVVAGEVTLTVGDATRTLGPGDRFQIPRDQPHVERYGPEGSTFWVARRHAPG